MGAQHFFGLYKILILCITGKRRNVLRNRTDSWDYDIDQLLLGTMLFTLVAFLFPTVLVYYALFATVGDFPFSEVEIANMDALEPTFHPIPPRYLGDIPSIPESFPTIHLDAKNERSRSSSR